MIHSDVLVPVKVKSYETKHSKLANDMSRRGSRKQNPVVTIKVNCDALCPYKHTPARLHTHAVYKTHQRSSKMQSVHANQQTRRPKMLHCGCLREERTAEFKIPHTDEQTLSRGKRSQYCLQQRLSVCVRADVRRSETSELGRDSSDLSLCAPHYAKTQLDLQKRAKNTRPSCSHIWCCVPVLALDILMLNSHYVCLTRADYCTHTVYCKQIYLTSVVLCSKKLFKTLSFGINLL